MVSAMSVMTMAASMVLIAMITDDEDDVGVCLLLPPTRNTQIAHGNVDGGPSP